MSWSLAVAGGRATGRRRRRLGPSGPGGEPRPDTAFIVADGPGNDGIHWSITGQDSVTFNWRGPDSVVRFGPTADYGRSVTAVAPVPYPFSSPGPYWETRLTGLAEDTLYHYQIGSGPDHTFRTPPPRGGAASFTVFAEGDIGDSCTYRNMSIVQSLIGGGAFTLLLGDLVYANAHGQEHVDPFFNDLMVWSQDMAAMPAWGNHEWDKPTNSCGLPCGESCGTQVCDDLRNYKGRWELPNPQVSPGSPAVSCCGEDWYWFEYGSVRFIAYPEPWSGSLIDWATQAAALMDAAQADPAIKSIVTFGHRPSYSSGHHPGKASLGAILDGLGENHSKYVLGLHGHSHDYERTFPQRGVVHLTVGTAGSSLAQDGSCLWLTCTQPVWSAFRAFYHGVVKLRFSPTGIEGWFLCGPAGGGANEIDGTRTTCALGSVIDSFTIGAPPTGEPDGVIDRPADDITIAVAEKAEFAATGLDPGGNLPLTYAWDFAGGAVSLMNVEDPGQVAFIRPGVYPVSLTVGNSLGIADPTPDTRVVTVLDSANLIGNPSFELDTAGWFARTGALAERVPGGRDGAWSLRLTGPASLASFGLNDSPNWVVVTPSPGPGTTSAPGCGPTAGAARCACGCGSTPTASWSGRSSSRRR